jgi:hypothetical protein
MTEEGNGEIRKRQSEQKAPVLCDPKANFTAYCFLQPSPRPHTMQQLALLGQMQ